MTVGGFLLVYAAIVGTAGLLCFQRAGWPLRTPRLAITVYLAACWSLLAALVLAGIALAVPATALGGGISHTLGACIHRMRHAYATPGGAAVAGFGLGVSGALLVRLVAATAHQLATTRRQAHRQVDLALLVGRMEPELGGALVVEDANATAFCVGGARPTVVFTTAALDSLNRDQVRAVLAHERAHLAHRHHRLLTAARVMARALPMIPLLRQAPAVLGRLVEMHADDAATQEHDRAVLATALVTLATTPARQPVLGASSTDALARMHRLLAPSPPLDPTARRLANVAVVALLVLPLLFAAAPALVALSQGRVAAQ
jgi:Zn-dependent protease with chaperone function